MRKISCKKNSEFWPFLKVVEVLTILGLIVQYGNWSWVVAASVPQSRVAPRRYHLFLGIRRRHHLLVDELKGCPIREDRATYPVSSKIRPS